MKRSLALLGLIGISVGSAAQHSHHGAPAERAASTAPKTAEPRKATSRPSAPPRSPSAFDDYRRFDPNEPLRDWRTVNEEVREAGGHVGILKAQSSGDKR